MEGAAGNIIAAALLQRNVFGNQGDYVDSISNFIQSAVRIKRHKLRPTAFEFGPALPSNYPVSNSESLAQSI